jgi:hypothetical protein
MKYLAEPRVAISDAVAGRWGARHAFVVSLLLRKVFLHKVCSVLGMCDFY